MKNSEFMSRPQSWQRCLLLLETAVDYLKCPDAYIQTMNVTINGKLRHLITYQHTAKGRNLRILHTNYARFLRSKYQQASSSYAYAKKKNILDCVSRHLNNDTFLKTDIHAYFDSVSYDKMIARIRKLRIPKEDREAVSIITQACFYDGHLPIGFVSSPVLSDLFLVSLDRKYQKDKEITYTRYADDFLISASGPEAHRRLSAFRLILEADLDKLDLELNRKKTYIRHLKQSGDAIHVLGLNIVKTDAPKHRITISDRYIRSVSKELCNLLIEHHEGDLDAALSKVYGQIMFIRNCSQSSFVKLQKMVCVKSGYNGDYSIPELRSHILHHSE